MNTEEQEVIFPKKMIVWNDPQNKKVEVVDVLLTHRKIPQFLVWQCPVGAYGIGRYDVYHNAEEI